MLITRRRKPSLEDNAPRPSPRATGACVVCGRASTPVFTPVLWPALIAEWGLSDAEAQLVDRREGQRCPDCGTPVRSAALAASVLRHVGWPGTLASWVESGPPLKVLEINRAGTLTAWLERLSGHRLVEYPEVDMHRLELPTASCDLVVHSDTLEHVVDPLTALRECRRVLRPDGALCLTIPVVPGRLSRRRDDDAPSYHGTEATQEYLVMTEYGADFWTQLLDAGFARLSVDADFWPTTIALVAQP